MDEKKNIGFDSENLAVPEVRIGEKRDESEDIEEQEDSRDVLYDNLAFPEIKIRKNKNTSST